MKQRPCYHVAPVDLSAVSLADGTGVEFLPHEMKLASLRRRISLGDDSVKRSISPGVAQGQQAIPPHPGNQVPFCGTGG